MHSLKSFTANKANEALGARAPFWQRESYDHWVRDLDELERIVNYIKANPVRAGSGSQLTGNSRRRMTALRKTAPIGHSSAGSETIGSA